MIQFETLVPLPQNLYRTLVQQLLNLLGKLEILKNCLSRATFSYGL